MQMMSTKGPRLKFMPTRGSSTCLTPNRRRCGHDIVCNVCTHVHNTHVWHKHMASWFEAGFHALTPDMTDFQGFLWSYSPGERASHWRSKAEAETEEKDGASGSSSRQGWSTGDHDELVQSSVVESCFRGPRGLAERIPCKMQ